MRVFAPTARAVRLGAVLAALWIGGLVPAAWAQEDAAAFEYARDAKTVVIQLSQIHGELVTNDPVPLLRVYGDGTVRVHYPAVMKKAGDYTMRLSEQEMQALLASLAGNGLFTVDVAAVKAKKAAAKKERGRKVRASGGAISIVMDAGSSIIETNLKGYKPAGADQKTIRTLTKRVAWTGLRHDAKDLPEIKEIQGLAKAEKDLLSLAQSKQLKKTEAKGGKTQ